MAATFVGPSNFIFGTSFWDFGKILVLKVPPEKGSEAFGYFA
jgi:hypothetical protein